MFIGEEPVRAFFALKFGSEHPTARIQVPCQGAELNFHALFFSSHVPDPQAPRWENPSEECIGTDEVRRLFQDLACMTGARTRRGISGVLFGDRALQNLNRSRWKCGRDRDVAAVLRVSAPPPPSPHDTRAQLRLVHPTPKPPFAGPKRRMAPHMASLSCNLGLRGLRGC